MSIVTYEDKFYEILKDMYIGTPIKGESGYVNLMTMKSKHFKMMEEELAKVVNDKTKDFPEFKEELYERLYDFFKDYFTATGSIYYTYNELNKSTYEKVYSDNEDISLFWKTQMLYYVKSDILYQDIEFEINDMVYYFDVSKLDHKRSNEKKEIIYRECKIEENKYKKKITFYPEYSTEGRTTRIDDILKKINNKKINITEEELLRIFRTFEKQSEVDYFINKNAKKFLRDRFDVYLYQYMFGDGERSYNQFNEKRINQLRVLKDVAYDVIDFISQFEDELVRIWNKPKFVLNSNYVITKNRILEKDNDERILNMIIKSEQIDEQINEWRELGIVDDEFEAHDILDSNHKYLPFDTKYFKEYELDILGLFDDLDNNIDGWLIKSENYQALNSILPKFKEKVNVIYIDPPFNKEKDADYLYSVDYKDSTWISLLENRLILAQQILDTSGNIYLRCDYNGNMYARNLMNKIFGSQNFKNEIVVAKSNRLKTKGNRFLSWHDTLFLYAKNIKEAKFNHITEKRDKIEWRSIDTDGETWSIIPKNIVHLFSEENIRYDNNGNPMSRARIILGKEILPPAGRRFPSQEKIFELEKKNRIRMSSRGNPQMLKPSEVYLTDNWTDFFGYSSNWDFQTENSEELLRRVVESTTNTDDIVLDFFLGSGTSIAVAQKLGRKWIGVEMGDHFYTIIIPRMKRVLAYDPTGISKDEDVKEIYAKDKAGGFFKYYELEQYEDTLKKSVYKDDEYLIYNQNKSPFEQYIFLRDEKLSYCMEIEEDEAKVDLSKLYDNIDIPETLSNLTGKWIKKITEHEVIFEDGTKVDLNNIDYKIIKPLIWWCE